jgi:hypothetical protein
MDTDLLDGQSLQLLYASNFKVDGQGLLLDEVRSASEFVLLFALVDLHQLLLEHGMLSENRLDRLRTVVWNALDINHLVLLFLDHVLFPDGHHLPLKPEGQLEVVVQGVIRDAEL